MVGSGGGVRGRLVVDWNILRLWEWGCDCGSGTEGCVSDTDIPALVDEMADEEGMLSELPELGEREV